MKRLDRLMLRLGWVRLSRYDSILVKLANAKADAMVNDRLFRDERRRYLALRGDSPDGVADVAPGDPEAGGTL